MRYITTKVLVVLAVAVVFGLMASWASALTGTPTWEPRETVSTDISQSDHRAAERMLACDHWGNVGIAYSAYNLGDENLCYAQRMPGFGWASWTVDATGHVGGYPSLAFDRYERPAISYYDVTNTALKYAYYDGSTWQTQEVDGAVEGVGEYTSVAFDVYGYPAISYYDNTNDKLKFAYDSDGDGTFTVSQVTDGTVDQGYYTTLAFDGQNRPMIVHCDLSNNYVRFSIHGPGGWVTTTAADDAVVSYSCSLAVNPATGNPAIAYIQDSTYDLIYIEWDGAQWQAATVDDTGASYPSLAFDPADNRPGIAYNSYGDLWFAWYDGQMWQKHEIDDSAGLYPSLAFNEYGDGWPVISYITGGGDPNTLYFVEDPPAVPEPATVSLLVVGGAGLLLRRKKGVGGAL